MCAIVFKLFFAYVDDCTKRMHILYAKFACELRECRTEKEAHKVKRHQQEQYMH